MFKQNAHKKELISKFGITHDLPLFNQEKEVPKIQHPDWLFNGNDIKAEIYHKMREKFADDAFVYLNALITLGGRATDHQIKDYLNDESNWPLHIVSARRNYFTNAPFYLVQSFPGQTIIGPKNRPNIIWFLNYKNLLKLTI
ncbi:MAG: hypothetical protein KF816_11550 [Melioribacteraceae bacterium]|nr:hypothetical protein [Melioribacteraceae bacterium]